MNKPLAPRNGLLILLEHARRGLELGNLRLLREDLGFELGDVALDLTDLLCSGGPRGSDGFELHWSPA
jgi:hypothetical protein